LGTQHYTPPSTIKPTTLPEFCRLFAELSDGEDDVRPRLTLLRRTSLHIFLLAGLPLPRHIFKIHGSHICNYLQDVSGSWWELDSQKEICRRLDFIEISAGEGDICVIPLGRAEMQEIRNKLDKWPAVLYGDMYVDLKRLVMCAIDISIRQARISS
jgi:hypothetical protein